MGTFNANINNEDINEEWIIDELDCKNKYIKYKIKYNNLEGGGKLWVLNRYENIIERKEYEKMEKFPEKYIYLNTKKIEFLSKKNYLNILRFLKEENYENKFYHLSIKPIKDLKDSFSDKKSWLTDSIYYNPKGLWISCGDAWIRWAGNDVHQWSLSTYIYEVTVTPTVLRISSLSELEKFIKKYKFPNSRLKIYNVINWKKVKEEYDGLIICPYLGDEIWGKKANKFGLYGDNKKIEEYIKKLVGDSWKNSIYFLAEWYRHWETATGTIWRVTGIKNIKLIKKLDTFENLNLKK